MIVNIRLYFNIMLICGIDSCWWFDEPQTNKLMCNDCKYSPIFQYYVNLWYR